jgi:RND family efflux transporter MFP subunit
MVAKADSAAATAQAQERLQTSGQSSPVALQRARADNQAAIAAIDEVKAEISSLLSEHKNQTATLELCKDLAANPVDLRGALAITIAETAKANAQLKQAEVEVEIAKRELNWATVLAPIDGVVLRLEAEPGEIVGHAAKGIVTLYNPAKLRARIDVPIDSLRGIREGQEVEITSDAIGDVVVKGIVQRFQHESDMLKNTLQVKIGLFDPPALLRPETLCRARFLASQSGANDGEQTIITAFRIPLAAITDGKTYIFDPKNGTARAVTIEVIGEEGDMRIVRGPLSPTHRVVIGQVTDGESIMELKL